MTHPTIILKATQACNNDFGRGRQQSMQCIEMEKKCDRRNSSRLSRTRKKEKGPDQDTWLVLVLQRN